MNTRWYAGFRKFLTIGCVGFLVIHSILIMYFIFSEKKYPLGKSVPAQGYQHLIHIGPFFREEAITSSTHFSVGLFKDSVWRYEDLVMKYISAYHRNPLRGDKLLARDYLKGSARELYRKSDRMANLKKLFRYTRTEYADLEGYDSIRWLYIVRWYQPSTKVVEPDTLFDIQFTPDEVE